MNQNKQEAEISSILFQLLFLLILVLMFVIQIQNTAVKQKTKLKVELYKALGIVKLEELEASKVNLFPTTNRIKRTEIFTLQDKEYLILCTYTRNLFTQKGYQKTIREIYNQVLRKAGVSFVQDAQLAGDLPKKIHLFCSQLKEKTFEIHEKLLFAIREEMMQPEKIRSSFFSGEIYTIEGLKRSFEKQNYKLPKKIWDKLRTKIEKK